ncbi:hypothetical protein JW921_07015, partial [Candidatus Fermentibacterales bacterium]|nr:hypothetical protein [Candidatus Fermentibacterales bacterium]
MRRALLSVRFELLATFRDRHTLIYTIVVPLFLYPALFFGMVQITQVSEGLEPSDLTIGIAGHGPLAQAMESDSAVRTLRIGRLPDLADSLAVSRAL